MTDRKEYHKAYRERNKERIKAYFEKNKDKLKAQKEEYLKEYLQKPEVKQHRKEYSKKYNQENKERIKEHRKEYLEKSKEKRRTHTKEHNKKIKQEFMSTYKLGKCCSFCGYSEHPEILQFHHKGEEKKYFNITRFSRSSNSSLLRAEIDKCILLCPNCHFLYHTKKKIRGAFK